MIAAETIGQRLLVLWGSLGNTNCTGGTDMGTGSVRGWRSAQNDRYPMKSTYVRSCHYCVMAWLLRLVYYGHWVFHTRKGFSSNHDVWWRCSLCST